MAKRQSSKAPLAATFPIPELPFVADRPDPSRPRRVFRDWFYVPEPAEYGAACTIGARWAAAYLDWVGANSARGHLQGIVGAIATSPHAAEFWYGDRMGFVVGFFATINDFAAAGTRVAGGARQHQEAKEARYAELERARQEEKREREMKAVARMNAARALKRTGRAPVARAEA